MPEIPIEIDPYPPPPAKVARNTIKVVNPQMIQEK
jgi:hypothetical protein